MYGTEGWILLSLVGLAASLFVGGWIVFRLLERWEALMPPHDPGDGLSASGAPGPAPTAASPQTRAGRAYSEGAD